LISIFESIRILERERERDNSFGVTFHSHDAILGDAMQDEAMWGWTMTNLCMRMCHVTKTKGYCDRSVIELVLTITV